MAFFLMFITFRMSQNLLLSYMALILVGSSHLFNIIGNHLLTENLSALLLIILSYFLYRSIKDNKIIYFMLSGLFLSLLVLTKATFIFLVFIIVILICFLLFRDPALRKKAAVSLILFILSFSIITGSWVLRNYFHFRDIFITNRGGIVLLVRANKNLMTFREYAASFIEWTPGGKDINEKLLNNFFNKEDFERFDDSNPNSFVAEARKARTDLRNLRINEGYDEQAAMNFADNELQNMAIQKIIRNPLRHLLATFQFAWRGLFVEVGYLFLLPGFVSHVGGGFFILIYNIILFASFFAMAILNIKNKNWDIFAFLVPGLYLFLINSLLTHNKPRYNIPILPILIISFILVINLIYSKRQNLLKR
jgi:4-amino-4-deoxy-L-arabinose transferase-like glycosyltransferase